MAIANNDRRLLRLQTALSKEKPSDSAKTENEGILKFLPKTVQEPASSFSWTEKLVPHPRNLDEHSRTGILTSGLRPRSRLPGPAARNQWLWESVARNSGATVPDFHGVPKHLSVVVNRRTCPSFFKERSVATPGEQNCQAKFLRVVVSSIRFAVPEVSVLLIPLPSLSAWDIVRILFL